tara:strand:+ start:1128 stop:1277 length:150 start_codon:yes stop_codon:yes gene_type:complete
MPNQTNFKVIEEIGVMLTSPFDDRAMEVFPVEEVATGPVEFSLRNGRSH